MEASFIQRITETFANGKGCFVARLLGKSGTAQKLGDGMRQDTQDMEAMSKDLRASSAIFQKQIAERQKRCNSVTMERDPDGEQIFKPEKRKTGRERHNPVERQKNESIG